MKTFISLAVASLLLSCSGSPSAPPQMLKDGELQVPADYRSWPKFLSDVARPDARQVRDIWINPVGARARSGEKFPNGTLIVMALYAAKASTDGSLLTGADGKPVKDKLLKVFVMGKNAGWGEAVPEGQRNGNWIYSAFLADAKTPSGDPIAPCRTCHLPLSKQDFVHRYDEYFSSRAPLRPVERPIQRSPYGGY
jgi:hemoglobin